MEATSQHTDDTVFCRQNDKFLLQCQVVQRSEYSKAKSLARWKAIITLAFAALSVVTSILDIDLLSAIFSFLAVALALFNKYSDEEIKATKKHAASIQQYIDASIFAPVIDTNISDWGDMPTKSDLADAVSKYGDKDTAAFVNWYSDYSSMNGESQVFYSQSENIRWDSTLHKEFKGFYVILMGVIALSFLITLLVFNPSFVKAFFILSWFLPIAEYGYSVIKEVNESISLLRDADNFSKELEKKLKTNSSKTLRKELIKLQHKIWNRRANGYLIPDWFYKLFMKKHQKKEDKIARTIQDLDK